MQFVPKGPINNIPALVQIMAWRRSGDKASESIYWVICVNELNGSFYIGLFILSNHKLTGFNVWDTIDTISLNTT